MKKALLIVLLTSFLQDKPEQVWIGRLSDSMCGASHDMKAKAENMSERECIFECIKALAKYVLVDEKQQVIPIANQDLGGLPLYAGRMVKITGEFRDGAIVATKVEPLK
jgi:propanediol dehydratase large subunit